MEKCKNRLYVFIAIVILCVMVSSIFITISFEGIQGTTVAYASINSSNVSVLYSNGEFNGDTLDKIAKQVGYSDVKDMYTQTKSGVVKNSSSFGDMILNVGEYTFSGTTRSLQWMPTYLSKDSDGNVILTLMLATELSTFPVTPSIQA